MCRQLIAEHYPWFLSTYNALPKNIMRADAVRPTPTQYFTLHMKFTSHPHP